MVCGRLVDREACDRHRRLALRLHRDSILEQARTAPAQQLELCVHRREPADSPRVAILHDIGEEARRIAALDMLDQFEVFTLDPFGNYPIGAESVAEFFADVREVHAREYEHAASLRAELASQSLDK